MCIVRLFFLSCLIAGIVPFLPGGQTRSVTTAFPGWPEQFEQRVLRPENLSAQEEQFLANFPGRIGKFTDGERVIIMRWVVEPTRKLHPAAHCFQGAGFSVRPMPLWLDEHGVVWGVMECRKHNEILEVREHFSDKTGASWSDVSSWYWNAILGRSSGPWWAVTVVEKKEKRK